MNNVNELELFLDTHMDKLIDGVTQTFISELDDMDLIQVQKLLNESPYVKENFNVNLYGILEMALDEQMQNI